MTLQPVYSNTFRIYTASLGHLAWTTAIIGGFVASVGVDYLATKACDRYLRRQVTRQALNKLEVQKHKDISQGTNQFRDNYWNSQIKFIHDTEGGILASSYEIDVKGRKISIYLLAALVLNVIEFTGASYLVGKLGLFEDLPLFIQLVISSLPVVLTWMLAFVQADWFHRPSYAAELYRKYREKSDGMVSESIDDTHKNLVRLNAGIKAMLNHQSEFPTVELAESYADIEYQQEQIDELQERARVKIKSIKRQFKAQKEAISAEYPKFQESLELTPIEIKRDRQSYEQQKNRALASQLQKIEQLEQKEIAEYEAKLTEQLDELEAKKNLATNKFNQKKAEFNRSMPRAVN